VSEDLKESGFDISRFCIHRNRCIRSHDFTIPDRAHTCIADREIGNPKDARALTSRTPKCRNPDRVIQGHGRGGGHMDQGRSKRG
jgi:hypothetical protein